MKRSITSAAAMATGAAMALANNADNFREHDHSGLMMTVIAMGVVFSALLILFLCFKWADKAVNIIMYQLFVRPYKAMRARLRHEPRADADAGADASVAAAAAGDDAATAAAIAVALFMAEDGMHDSEPDILTLAPQAAPAWTGVGRNQKQQPRRRF